MENHPSGSQLVQREKEERELDGIPLVATKAAETEDDREERDEFEKIEKCRRTKVFMRAVYAGSALLLFYTGFKIAFSYGNDKAGLWSIPSLGEKMLWGAPWCRPTPLVILLIWGWVANLYIAEKVGFDLPSLLGFTHHNVGAVARSVAMATVLWLTGVIMIMNVFPLVFGSDVVMMGESVDPGHHMLLAVFFIVLLFAPLKCGRQVLLMDDSMRDSLRTVIIDILMAPFAPVTFFHVLIADYSTSLAKNFADVFVGACVGYTSDAAPLRPGISLSLAGEKEQYCIHHWCTPLCIALPSVWRICQCLRRYHDTGKNENLWNLLKYSTAFPVIILSTMKRHIPGAHDVIIPAYLVAVAVNSLYSFWWDVVMDWGLPSASGWPLAPAAWRMRAAKYYPWQVYIVIAVVNLLLRISWSLKLLDVQILGTHFHLPSLGGEVTVFVLSVLEVLRRTLWTAIRIEWEWIKTTPQL